MVFAPTKTSTPQLTVKRWRSDPPVRLFHRTPSTRVDGMGYTEEIPKGEGGEQGSQKASRNERCDVTRTGAARRTWRTCTVTVINTFCTCQADVDTKMTVGMFMCMTQNGEMCTVGTSTCLFCEDAPQYEYDLVMNRSV